LAAYHEQTEPLEVYYRQQGLLVEVDGTRDIGAVAQDMGAIVERHLGRENS